MTVDGMDLISRADTSWDGYISARREDGRKWAERVKAPPQVCGSGRRTILRDEACAPPNPTALTMPGPEDRPAFSEPLAEAL